ncbi:MAG TPA: hypothetical protein VGH33_17150 [Isosphaeraceae bacterium]
MATRIQKLAVLSSITVLLAGASRTFAQQPTPNSAGGYQAQQSLSSATYAGATVTPGTPFLNPYLMPMGQANPDYMTYMYLQNQRNGGIGSGVISGTRVAPNVPAGSSKPTRPAASTLDASTPLGSRGPSFPQRPPVELNRVTLPMIADSPTGNTGASFMRGPRTNQGANRFFNRTTAQRNNGR